MLEFTEQEKQYLLDLGYETLRLLAAGEDPLQLSVDTKRDGRDQAVYAVLWRDGDKLSSRYTREPNLAHTVIQSVHKAVDHGQLEIVDPDEMQLHLFLMGPYLPLDQGYQQ